MEPPSVGTSVPDFAGNAEKLLLVYYDELRRLARARLARHSPHQTLAPTELVHEAYMRVIGDKDVRFEGRRHFFFAATRAMRDILVERARRKASLKRGGGCLQVELVDIGLDIGRDDVLDLDRALDKLERVKPDNAQVVQLRYFGGLTVPEVAEVTGWSQATVKRRWSHARAWLLRELSTRKA